AGAARADARGLERAAGAVRVADEERRGLVDVDRAPAALRRERRGLRRHLLDGPDDPEREVDEVRAEVGDRRAAEGALEAPVEGDARVEELVGEPRAAPEQDVAD